MLAKYATIELIYIDTARNMKRKNRIKEDNTMIKTTESTVRKPLAEAMAAYCQRQTLRLHMPGHKGKPPQAGLGSTWGQAWQQDLTEVPV